MTFAKWFVFLGIFMAFSLIHLIGEAAYYGTSEAADISNLLGFQVDEIGAGGGFIGIPRALIGFFTSTLPKLATFNYNFLQGDLEIVRWLFMSVFGGALIIMVITSFTGAHQRNI